MGGVITSPPSCGLYIEYMHSAVRTIETVQVICRIQCIQICPSQVDEMIYRQNLIVDVLTLCCYFLLLALFVASGDQSNIRCGKLQACSSAAWPPNQLFYACLGSNHTLKSKSFVLYEQQGSDVFINVWSPHGFRNSTLPVWTVNSRLSNVTSAEVSGAMLIHYGGLTLYHVDPRFHNTMYQYNVSAINRRETYTSGWMTLRIGCEWVT